MSQESRPKAAAAENFSAYQIISLKRDGKKLTTEQISWFIEQMTLGKVADYQVSALLMAIYLNGMDGAETAALTDAMLYSGQTVDFGDNIQVVDKHSTGGVGDKASFILAPLASACGVKVPMMAGRGLGHTGGTIDKVESISGFETSLSLERFKNDVLEYGLALTGQTDQIATADKKIYALRDVTATIESIPLITASIMSKKLAEGARGIVMDIKTGNGAFMSDPQRARQLADSLRETAERTGRSMVTFITDMDQPLGHAIGNSVEIKECLDVLKGGGPSDLIELSVELAAAMIYLAGKADSLDSGRVLAQQALDSGRGLEEFKKLIERQGGDASIVENPEKLPHTQEQTQLKAATDGLVARVDCLAFGLHCVSLGGGRRQQTDKIDPAVGIIIHKKEGDSVKKGEPLVTIHHHKQQEKLVENIIRSIEEKDIRLEKSIAAKNKLIKEVNISLSQTRKNHQC